MDGLLFEFSVHDKVCRGTDIVSLSDFESLIFFNLTQKDNRYLYMVILATTPIRY